MTMLRIEISNCEFKCAAKGTTEEIMCELTASVYTVAKHLAKPLSDEERNDLCSRLTLSLLEAVHAVRENHTKQ